MAEHGFSNKPDYRRAPTGVVLVPSGGQSRQPSKTEQIMSTSSLLRVAMFAFSLLVTTGAMSTAFAAPQSNSSVYDGPNFVASQTEMN
jgi:hypothetical protein